MDNLSDLGSLFEGERFATGLRPYLPLKGSERTTDYAHKMATQLIVMARVHLGHKSMRTTYASYMGTEGLAASRRINALLQGLRDDKRGAA